MLFNFYTLIFYVKFFFIFFRLCLEAKSIDVVLFLMKVYTQLIIHKAITYIIYNKNLHLTDFQFY